jgi:hypothetical protein
MPRKAFLFLNAAPEGRFEARYQASICTYVQMDSSVDMNVDGVPCGVAENIYPVVIRKF